MLKERLFIGPRMHGTDAGTAFGVWASESGSRFWRRTVGDALYEFAAYADGLVLVTRWSPGELRGRIVHQFR